MSDDSTKPAEVTPEAAPVVMKPEAPTVKVSPEEAQAWLEKSERFVKLVAENLRYGSWTKRFVTIGSAAFLALNPMSAGKAAELVGVRELPKEYTSVFWLGMGAIGVGAVGAAIVTLPKRTFEPVPDRQAIKGLRSFELKDAEIFKRLERGRDLQEVLDAVDTADLRLFVLMGESGVGKSSLLQAGLLPNLGQVGFVGMYVKFTNREPLDSIGKVLGVQESGSLVEMLRSAVAKAGRPIVLILDQFEQFFVQFQEEKRAEFIGELKAWYESDVAVKILIGIRGDLSDRLLDIQKALGYSLRPDQSYRLERFAPAQATEVLRVIAETEKWSFNQAFVEEMTRDELAGLDGKISPVDVQVLAQMVSRESDEEKQRFDRTAFQKLGGVDGLLGRSLQRSLDAIPIKSDRDRALEVLLALTDLERNVRSGAFSVEQLQGMTEKVHGSPSAVESAVQWLLEARLISPGDSGGAVVYELAHERLVPALRQVANQELTDANKANLLLDRRVNEWLGSGKSGRYLFSVKELWLLRQQRGFLEWGERRSQKEALVKRSWGRSRWGIGTVGTPLALGLTFGIWSHTQPGQVQWARWDLAALANMGALSGYSKNERSYSTSNNFDSTLDLITSIENSPFPDLWIRGFAFDGYSSSEVSKITKLMSKSKDQDLAKKTLQQIITVAGHFSDSQGLSAGAVAYEKSGNIEKGKQILEKALDFTKFIKDESEQSIALSSIAEAYGRLEDAEKGKQILEKALDLNKFIKGEPEQISALCSIAEAYGKLGDAERGKQTLEKAPDLTKFISNEYSQSSALSSIAKAYGKLGDAEKGKQILEKAIDLTKSINHEYVQQFALSSVAEASSKLEDAERGKQILEKAIDLTKSIKDGFQQSSALSSIAQAYGKLGNAEKGKQILEKALEIAKSIKSEYSQITTLSSIAEAYAKLGDAEKVKQTLEKAIDLTKSIKNKSQQSWAFSSIVEVIGKLENREIGKQLLEKAIEFTKSIEDENTQRHAISSIALAYLKLGDRDRAKAISIDLLSKVKPEISNSDLNQNIGILQAELGNWDEALRFSKHCQVDGKVAVLAQILRVNAEQKHPEFKELRKEKEE